ncbi:GDPP1 phosphorylase, partial [Ciccaba nigrolineata]|nr:GDPP1 phosphorylase [Ciccaba nigrolineata]
LQGAGWGGEPGSAPSRFDRALLAGWSDRMERGLFRYRLGPLPTRVLPGPMGLVAQLNVQRGTERRPPQAVRSLRQPFDPGAFNFTRIAPGEVLLRLRRAGVDGDRLLVAINASPLERGHVLLLPEPARGLRASVNPRPLHGLYLDRPLLVESAPARPLCPPRGLSLLTGVPAPAFLFYAAGPAGREALAGDVCRAAEHLEDTGLAYNVFATRGDPPEG